MKTAHVDVTRGLTNGCEGVIEDMSYDNTLLPCPATTSAEEMAEHPYIPLPIVVLKIDGKIFKAESLRPRNGGFKTVPKLHPTRYSHKASIPSSPDDRMSKIKTRICYCGNRNPCFSRIFRVKKAHCFLRLMILYNGSAQCRKPTRLSKLCNWRITSSRIAVVCIFKSAA
jgi:hypothetical protein